MHTQSPQRSVEVISTLSAQEMIQYILEYRFCPSEGSFQSSLVKFFKNFCCLCNCCLTVEFVGRFFRAQILLQTVKETTVFMVYCTGVLHVVGAFLQSSDLKMAFFFYAIRFCVHDECRGSEASMRLQLGQYNSVQNHLLLAQATIAAFTQVHTTTEMKYGCIVPCTTRISLTLSLSVLNAGLQVLREHHCTVHLEMILWKKLAVQKSTHALNGCK